MSTYNISMQDGIMKVGFGLPAQNDQIVRDAQARLEEMVAAGELPGGPVIRINGPASLPVAMVIAHTVGHLYGTVACFDPKMGKYVVAIAHDGQHNEGDLLD